MSPATPGDGPADGPTDWPTDWNAERHIDAVAPLLGLRVTAAQRPGVRRFLEVARGMADQVERACPADTLDLAPVFTPVAGRAPAPAPAPTGCDEHG